MEVICIEDKAFKALIDKVVAYVKSEHDIKEEKWINTEKAMAMLDVTSKTSLQKYRDENSIKYTELSPDIFCMTGIRSGSFWKTNQRINFSSYG